LQKKTGISTTRLSNFFTCQALIGENCKKRLEVYKFDVKKINAFSLSKGYIPEFKRKQNYYHLGINKNLVDEINTSLDAIEDKKHLRIVILQNNDKVVIDKELSKEVLYCLKKLTINYTIN